MARWFTVQWHHYRPIPERLPHARCAQYTSVLFWLESSWLLLGFTPLADGSAPGGIDWALSRPAILIQRDPNPPNAPPIRILLDRFGTGVYSRNEV
jgi:hypothetical protein